MEEIPGPQTFSILNKRIVDLLSGTFPELGPEYPCKRSWRAVPGQDTARYLDHTLLKPGATRGDFLHLCKEAREWSVWSVCVPPNRVELCAEELLGSPVKVCTVIGFPLGYSSTEARVKEIQVARAQGASELDVVIPVGMLKDGNYLGVFHDLSELVRASEDALVKVILETSELSLEEKIVGAYLACYAGAGFLKTSTGFASSGASLDDLYILRVIAGDRLGVKASGGVRTPEFAQSCIKAGADRIGTSSSGVILAKSAAGGAQPHY